MILLRNFRSVSDLLQQNLFQSRDLVQRRFTKGTHLVGKLIASFLLQTLYKMRSVSNFNIENFFRCYRMLLNLARTSSIPILAITMSFLIPMTHTQVFEKPSDICC